MFKSKVFAEELAHFFSCIDFETASLDTRAIEFMNIFPGVVTDALDTNEEVMKLFGILQCGYMQYIADTMEHETSHPHD